MAIQNPGVYHEKVFNAHIFFKLDGVELGELPPEHIRSLEVVRVTEGVANEFTLECYDDTAIKLEALLAFGARKCEFYYGYSEGPESRIITGSVMGYDVSLTAAGGMYLSVKGVSSVAKAMGEPKTASYDVNVSEIVKKVAEGAGWKIGDIEETVPILIENEEAGVKKPRVFKQENIPDLTFIQNLTIYAKSAKTGETGYRAYFVDGADGPVFHFRTVTGGNLDRDSRFSFEWGTSETNVVTMKMTYPGLFHDIRGGDQIGSTSVDPNTNETTQFTHTSATNENKQTSGSRTNSPSEYSVPVQLFSSNFDEMAIKVSYAWTKVNDSYIKAEIDIMGNTKIELMEVCDLMVVVKNGVVHHSSGKYVVLKIVDTIVGGKFLTKLSLTKKGNRVGKYQLSGKDVDRGLIGAFVPGSR